MRQLLVVLVASLVVAAGCQKAPEEPLSRDPAPAPSPPAVSPKASPITMPSGAVAPPPCVDTSFDLGSAPEAKPAPSCPRDPTPSGPLATRPLRFVEADKTIQAELARTPEETTKGLMYRTSMPKDQGMLFRLGERRRQAFWMRNTCLPLDMLFIDEDQTIVGILENVPVLNEEERSVRCSSRFVLEMNAGWARKNGVRPGQRVVLPSEMR